MSPNEGLQGIKDTPGEKGSVVSRELQNQCQSRKIYSGCEGGKWRRKVSRCRPSSPLSLLQTYIHLNLNHVGLGALIPIWLNFTFTLGIAYSTKQRRKTIFAFPAVYNHLRMENTVLIPWFSDCQWLKPKVTCRDQRP